MEEAVKTRERERYVTTVLVFRQQQWYSSNVKDIKHWDTEIDDNKKTIDGRAGRIASYNSNIA